jgi:hypothetical protein
VSVGNKIYKQIAIHNNEGSGGNRLLPRSSRLEFSENVLNFPKKIRIFRVSDMLYNTNITGTVKIGQRVTSVQFLINQIKLNFV